MQGLSAMVIFIIYYFDTTIKSTDQIEAKLDVPILGSIPDYNQKKRGKNNGRINFKEKFKIKRS